MKNCIPYLQHLKFHTPLVLLFLLFSSLTLSADVLPQQQIRGKVVDVQGLPIPGVNVLLEGTAVGTVTDINGDYSLEVPALDGTLLFSYVGFVTEEIAIDQRTEINVTLEEDAQNLEEIVVIGYGKKSREELIGSVGQITTKQIDNRPIAQLRNALTGQIAGVTVTDNSGRPGRPSGSISIRGVGSFGATPSALVIVDGVPVDNFNDINPNDVASISVLKDASSAAIYGSRAANGVILITTKTGNLGSPKFTYESYVAIESPTAMPDYINSWEYQRAYFEAENNSSTLTPEQQEIVDKYRAQNDPEFPNTDFLGSVLSRDGVQTSHNITVDGGGDYNRYRVSLGYLHQDGLVESNKYERYNFRLNLETDLSDRLTMTTRLAAVNSEVNEPRAPAGARGFSGYMVDIIGEAARLPGTFVGRYENGDFGPGLSSSGTPISNLATPSFNTQKELNLNGSLEFDFQATKDLNFRLLTSYIRDTGRDKDFRSTQRINDNIFLGPNQLTEYFNARSYFTVQAVGEYTKSIGKHHFGLLAGYSFEDYKRENFQGFRDNLPGNDLSVLDVGSLINQQASGTGSENALESQFGRINYDYDLKYLIEGVVRRDGSSRFPPTKKYGIFPSVAVGWRIGEEDFIKDNLPYISELKLKASWGKLGNQNISNYPFQNTLNSSDSNAEGSSYSFGGEIAQGVARDVLVDPNLHWETTRTKDIGMEVGLWENKLNFSATYFDRYTYDILYSPSSSVSNVLGFRLSEQNTGELENTGWEFTLNHGNTLGKFSYNIGGNFTIINNKVLDLGVGNVNQPNGLVGNGSSLFIGHPMEIYYGYVADGLFVDEADVSAYPDQSAVNPGAQPGDIRYMDISGPEGVPDGQVDATYDRQVLGSRIPKHTYGINMNVNYGGWDLRVLLQGVAGVTGRLSEYAGWALYQNTGNIQRWQYEGRWTPENPDRNAVYPRLENVPGGGTPNTELSSYWLLDGSYMRIKNVQLGYAVSEDVLQRVGIDRLRLYVGGENLHTFSNYREGWDPEINTTGSYYPILSTYSLGLNITF